MKMFDANGKVFQFTAKVQSLAHCRSCCQPMFNIYDTALRDTCHECGGSSLVACSVETLQDRRDAFKILRRKEQVKRIQNLK